MEKRGIVLGLIISAFIIISIFPLSAFASWNGIIPNETTKDEVLELLGEPSMDSGVIMIYDGEKAPTNTKGVAVYCVDDIVVMVRVLPKKDMTEKEISGTFGTPTTISLRDPQIEEQVFERASGKVVIIFTQKNRAPIRIDYF